MDQFLKKNFFKKKIFRNYRIYFKKFNKKKNAMLIFNKKLSVCPITTHLPLKYVSKKLNKKNIKDKIKF